MRKKFASIIIFVIVLVFPMVLWPLFDYVDNIEINENRQLASYPDKFDDQYFVNFDKYFLDHLPLRKPAIKAYTVVENRLSQVYDSVLGALGLDHFKEQNDVIFGKGEWLFYCAEHSLDDYRGSNLPSMAELQTYAHKLGIVNDYFSSLGKKFAIMILPNKEQIYTEYMPDGIRVLSSQKCIDKVYDYLTEKTDVTFVYPKSEFIEAKADCQVYFKQDTHWTKAGAYIGTMKLLDDLEIQRGEATLGLSHRDIGDLANMIIQPAIRDVDYTCVYRPEYEQNCVYDDETTRCSSSNPNCKKLVLFGDSFRLQTVDILGKEFSESVFTHMNRFNVQNNYFKEDIADADVIVLQAVERHKNQIFDEGEILDKLITTFNLAA